MAYEKPEVIADDEKLALGDDDRPITSSGDLRSINLRVPARARADTPTSEYTDYRIEIDPSRNPYSRIVLTGCIPYSLGDGRFEFRLTPSFTIRME
jgi:hypothetical protein